MYGEDRQIIHLLSVVYKIGIFIHSVFHNIIFVPNTCCIDLCIYIQQRYRGARLVF